MNLNDQLIIFFVSLSLQEEVSDFQFIQILWLLILPVQNAKKKTNLQVCR